MFLLFDILAVNVFIVGIDKLTAASSALEQRPNILEIIHQHWRAFIGLEVVFFHFSVTPCGGRLLKRFLGNSDRIGQFLVAGMIIIAVVAIASGTLWANRITTRATAAGYHNCDSLIPEPHQFYNLYVAPGLPCRIIDDRKDRPQ
jgi:hypothetical protein